MKSSPHVLRQRRHDFRGVRVQRRVKVERAKPAVDVGRHVQKIVEA
jgi:hypothetical protein